ncbi:tetratricopeptide repeat protein [Marichromatium gracile]|nr:tetratricopeptide repeat protein [Marichromatium gracile]
MAATLALNYAHHERVTEAQLRAIGTALWQALEATTDLETARARAGLAVQPIIIESGKPQILQLPWETLHHPTLGFLGRDRAFTLSRRLPSAVETLPPIEPGPLRVLLFTALPDDLHPERGRLDVEAEQDAVQEALAPRAAEGLVDLRMPNDGRFATLGEQIRDFQPHLVFLSGHGAFVDRSLTDGTAQGVFVFEGPNGESHPVTGHEIASAFVGAQVQCLVLSACESGKGASDALNSSLAQQLSLSGVPHVVGMRESLLDLAGIQFARAFCDALTRQERVDVALQAARAAMLQPPTGGLLRDICNRTPAELSHVQWCLPMLLSHDPGRALIDWAFDPQPPTAQPANQSLDTVTLPPRFLGRRKELRALETDLLGGRRRRVLITGPGGQGKTALAGTLAQRLQQTGYEVLAWSARPENPWEDFIFELELALTPDNAERYTRMRDRCPNETKRAEVLLRLLMQQTRNRLVLLLDNLETLQDPDTLALVDSDEGARINAWINAAQQQVDKGLVLLLTSRWRLPDWPEADHWALEHAAYGDFLQHARALRLPAHFYEARDRLRRAYRVLHGNWRGLEFFAAAIGDMDSTSEAAFLDQLADTEAEVQTDMALAAIIAHRSEDERALLKRLPSYHTPVPREGIVKLALDLPTPERLLDGLLSVSLVEQREAFDLQTREYQCPPLVADWLRRNGTPAPRSEWLAAAADYQVHLSLHERKTLPQAITAHEALTRAGKQTEADRWALDWIVPPLNRAGLYATLLNDWLPTIRQSQDPATRAEALGQTGKQRLHTGDYETALNDLQQSLAIQQEIGDRPSEGTTLNNISQIFKARGDYETALSYLKQALAIWQEIGDRSGEGTTLNNISQIYDARGDLDTALSYLKQSLAIQQEIGDRPSEGTTLNNTSQIYYARGDLDTALSYLKQSLAIRQEIGDRSGEGTTLNNISQIFKARGNLDTALSHLKQALAIQQEIGDRPSEGVTLNNIAGIHRAYGDYETALSYLKQSLAIQQEVGDRSGEGSTLNNISQIYDARGDYETALSYLKQSLAIQQEIGDRSGEGTTLNNISLIYNARGDFETTLSYLKQALAIQQEIGDRSGEGTTLNNISQIYDVRGDLDTALSYLKQSLAIQQEIGGRLGEGTTLNNISQIYHARGDYETALSYLKQSLAIQQEIGDSAGLCATLFNMGHIHWQNDEQQEAISAWVTVYRLARAMGLAQDLDALTQLAEQLGLPGGLEGWETLAQRMDPDAPDGESG